MSRLVVNLAENRAKMATNNARKNKAGQNAGFHWENLRLLVLAFSDFFGISGAITKQVVAKSATRELT